MKTNDLSYFFKDGGTPFGVPPFWFIAIDYFKSLLQMGCLELHTNREVKSISLCAGSDFFHFNVCFDFPVVTEFVHCTKSDVLGVSTVINSSVKFLITEERSDGVITVRNVICDLEAITTELIVSDVCLSVRVS